MDYKGLPVASTRCSFEILYSIPVVGKKGLEPLTLRLSGAYSYLLSYLPAYKIGLQHVKIMEYDYHIRESIH